jgi:hypothetical protein
VGVDLAEQPARVSTNRNKNRIALIRFIIDSSCQVINETTPSH